MLEQARLLIWGTTYPEFSAKHFETVCTGAIHEATGKAIRIYPIPLRYMNEGQQFSKYQWISAQIEKNPSDPRPESYRIFAEGIALGEQLGTTESAWLERRKWMLNQKNVFASVEDLWAAQESHGTSLGFVRPRKIDGFGVRWLSDQDRAEWEQHRQRAEQQRELFLADPSSNSAVRDLVFMPVRYTIRFHCEGSQCKGHEMSTLDWEVYALSRRQWRERDGDREQVRQDVYNALSKRLCSPTREGYLLLGNTKAHPGNFMVVGDFSPPPPPKQGSLF